jgi:hypothetical protein
MPLGAVMNFQLSPSVVIPLRARTERVYARIGERVRAALRALLKRWREHKTRRAEPRAFDAIGDMNEYMLRDIGAPDWLIARAVARRDAHHRLCIPGQLPVTFWQLF